MKIKTACINHIDILERNSSKYDLEIYIEQVNDIKEVVDKLITLNNNDEFIGYSKDGDIKNSLYNNQPLLDDYLEEVINDNSIGVVNLCEMLNDKKNNKGEIKE